MLATTKNGKTKNYSLEGSALTIFSTPVNQYFLYSKVSDNNAGGNFSVSGYLNIDSTASLRLEAAKKFSFSNSQISLGTYLVTKGFRWPMGIAQNENAGLSLFGKNSYGKVGFNSNLNGLSFSLEASKTNLLFQVGKDPNFVVKISNGNSYFGLNLGSGGVQSVQRFQDGPFSLKLNQHFENGKDELGVRINVSTPITFEASISTSSIGWSISKTWGSFKAAVNWEKESTQTREKIKATLSDTSMLSSFPLTWAMGFQTGQSTSLFYLDTNLSLPFGNITLHSSSLPTLFLNY